MIPAFQDFLFGGCVNPYVSRVATFYMRENLVPHVARLVDVYRAKRDAMLKGLWEVLEGTDVEISKPEGGFFISGRRRGPARVHRAGASGVPDLRGAGPRLCPGALRALRV